MHINQFIAKAAGISRRQADAAVSSGRVTIDGRPAQNGASVEPTQTISLDGVHLHWQFKKTRTIMLNKPIGYVCSRNGQGRKTVFELLPKQLHYLQVVGRLDKNSSGLLLLTSDGQLAYRLTHPKFEKDKVYHVWLNKPLEEKDARAIIKGVELEDGVSALQLKPRINGLIEVRMSEGRNRQIRRTFAALGYQVTSLNRVQFGEYSLGSLASGAYKEIKLS